MKTTKEDILKQISKLEDEIQILRKKAENIDSKVNVWDYLLNVDYNVKVWGDLEEINGYYIEIDSKIVGITDVNNDSIHRNIFKTKRQAKSALAMAQISQLMPYYGGEITNDEWDNYSINKYVLKRDGNKIESVYSNTYYFLAFHTEEQRDEFLINNEQLVTDYLMIE